MLGFKDMIIIAIAVIIAKVVAMAVDTIRVEYELKLLSKQEGEKYE